MRRLAAVAAFGAACAAVIVIAAGGGARSSRPLSGPLDPVLGHFPRAAPFVAIVDRRLDAGRRRALTALVARLGFGRTAGVLESVLDGVVRPPVAIGLEQPVALRRTAIGH